MVTATTTTTTTTSTRVFSRSSSNYKARKKHTQSCLSCPKRERERVREWERGERQREGLTLGIQRLIGFFCPQQLNKQEEFATDKLKLLIINRGAKIMKYENLKYQYLLFLKLFENFTLKVRLSIQEFYLRFSKFSRK